MRLSHSAEAGQEEGNKAREVERGSLGYLATSKDLTGEWWGPPCALTVSCALMTGKESAGWMAEMTVTGSGSEAYQRQAGVVQGSGCWQSFRMAGELAGDLRPGKEDKKSRMEPEAQWLNSPHLGGAGWRSGQRIPGRG